jgi:serine/threonine protein kinase
MTQPLLEPAGEQLLARFDKAWRSGTPPRIEDFLSGSDALDTPARRELLAELVATDLGYRWRQVSQAAGPRNQGPRLEHYVERLAELGPLEQLPAELIGEEYWARQRWGDRPDHKEYLVRFPRYGAGLRELLLRLDRRLAAEFAPEDRRAAGVPNTVAPDPRPAGAPQTITSGRDLIDALRRYSLLGARELDELVQDRGTATQEPRLLAQRLLERNWLTPYQVNQLLQGKGGELLLGSYVLLERLGEGGAGQVFKARHQKMNRVVAIKLVRKELLTDAEVVARFYREIQIVSQLDHPNIVHAYDAGPAGAGHFLAMEYVEGTDLGKLVKKNGPLQVAQACEYIRQAALGLQHAHERGLVHRDIKPHNLLLASGGRESPGENLVKLTDLGLARLPRVSNEEMTAVLTGVRGTGTLTPENAQLIGTIDYMAPEQADNFHQADIRADIYSLGCTFFYLLAGQPPFAAATLPQKLLKHQQTPPPPLSQFRSDVPQSVCRILDKMLAKKPEERYQTPAAVAAALQPLGRLPISQPIRVQARKRRWRLPAALAVILLLSGTIFLMSKPWRISDGQQSSTETASEILQGPLDRLQRQDIPAEKLVRGLPEEVVAVLGAHDNKPVKALAFNPDGRRLTWAREEGPEKSGGPKYSVHLWDAETGNEARGFPRSAPKVRTNWYQAVHQLAFSPDGQKLAVAVRHGAVLLDVSSAKEERPLEHDGDGGCLAFSPDGHTLATGAGKTTRLWDLSTVKAGTATEIPQGALSLSFSPDSNTLAIGPGQGEVQLWSVAGKPSLRQTLPQGYHPARFALTAGKNLLATGGPNNVQVLHWDLDKDRAFPRPKPKQFHVSEGLTVGLAYTPDGTRLAVAKKEQLFVWDVISGERYYRPLPCEVKHIAFAPDGRHLATANMDGTVYIFRLPARLGR